MEKLKVKILVILIIGISLFSLQFVSAEDNGDHMNSDVLLSDGIGTIDGANAIHDSVCDDDLAVDSDSSDSSNLLAFGESGGNLQDSSTQLAFGESGENFVVSDNQLKASNEDGSSKVTIEFKKMSRNGPVSDSISNTISYGGSWGVGMAKFNNQIANFMEFDYENNHYSFTHWVDEDGNIVSDTQRFYATGEDYVAVYTAVYDVSPLGTLKVEYNDPYGHGSAMMTYTEHNTAYAHTFSDPPDYDGDKVVFKYWQREDTGEIFNAGDKLEVFPEEFDGKNLTIVVNAVYSLNTEVETKNLTCMPGDIVDITFEVLDKFETPVLNGTLRVNVAGTDYIAEVIEGKAVFEDVIIPGPGNYSYDVSYDGNDYYNPSIGRLNLNVLKLNTSTEASDVSGKAGERKDITADIMDQNGNPVKNGTAVLIIGEKEYSAEVKDGKAVFKDVELPSSSTDAIINYLGNEYYNPSNNTIHISIIDEPEHEQKKENISNDENSTLPNQDFEDFNDKSVKSNKAYGLGGMAAGNPIAVLILVFIVLIVVIPLRYQK